MGKRKKRWRVDITSNHTDDYFDKTIRENFGVEVSDTESADKTPAKQKIPKHRKNVILYESLHQKNPFIQTVPSSSSNTQIMQTDKLSQVDNITSTRTDIWNNEGEATDRPKKKHNASIIPADCSFNPSLEVHQESSLTVKVSDSMIEMMHKEADKVWVPELARVMKETKEPFINIIYDSDPLPKLFWNNIVLVGEAALGCCLEKWGSENRSSALEEYQPIRLPVISKQVLHARKLGRIKQRLALNCARTFDPTTASQEECLRIQQRSMPYFEGVPITFDITLPSKQIGS